VLAYNFVGRVAFESLRACVPGRHMPLAIQQINRVILDGVDEQLETAKAIEAVRTSVLTHAPVHRRFSRSKQRKLSALDPP
jgi:hypothetical protein